MVAKKAAKKSTKTTNAVILEALRPDGATSMFIGRFVAREDGAVTLTDATWIASTGRRHLFLYGKPDGQAEWEPHPDGAQIRIEAPLLWIGPWEYGLEQFRKAR